MEALIQALPDLKVVGSAGVPEAASMAAQLLPDAVLIDAGEGEPEDLELIARLASTQPGLPMVAMGGQDSSLSQALSFGASALLPTDVDPKSLRLALLAAQQGLVTIPRSELPAILPEEEAAEPAPRAPAESLTPRELAVLQLMARGLTNRQIGIQLKISEHTVKFHAASVLGKLSARSRAEAVARAVSLGWILV
jgi:DNA-binding NarL/FixJ family response regulator